MTEKKRMLAGELYRIDPERDREILGEFKRARRLTREFNATSEEEGERRDEILRELFGAVGRNCYIEPSFRCDYGSNIFIGDDFYANFDCIILDVARVSIGSRVFFAPRGNLYTAAHPIDAEARSSGLEYARPIVICDDVWLGGGVIVNPGVTVGAGSVIGAGAVVTRDIPAGVVAAGNPCRSSGKSPPPTRNTGRACGRRTRPRTGNELGGKRGIDRQPFYAGLTGNQIFAREKSASRNLARKKSASPATNRIIVKPRKKTAHTRGRLFGFRVRF